jgi:hypothetical protein
VDNIPSALKAFVILLAVLIALRGGEGEQHRQQAPQALLLPAGARIEQVVIDGRRLVLLGTDAAGAQFLAVVDPVTGERLSLLRVRPE